MQKRFHLTCDLLAMLALVCWTSAAVADDRARHSRTEAHMGVEFEVVLYSADATLADKALTAAMARVAALDKALSDYDLDSELSRLSATSSEVQKTTFPAVKVSDDLWSILSYAQQVSRQSDGAFDVTVGPLTKLWRRARRQRALPEPELLQAAKAAVGYEHLKLDRQARTAQLLKPNMRLDLGGIAKGYAADEALAEIKKVGLTQALVRASGDIAAGDPPPGEAGWLVGIAPLNPDEPPKRFVRLSNKAISTSGDSRQHLEIGGKRYSHILDPRTGLGIEVRSSVTVIARLGMIADALDTTISVLGPDKGLALVEKYKGAAFLMISEDREGNVREVASTNFAGFEVVSPEK